MEKVCPICRKRPALNTYSGHCSLGCQEAALEDISCRFNSGVLCGIKDLGKCGRCGWNPAVERMRKEALYGKD